MSSGYKDVFKFLDIPRQYTISGLTQISQTSFHPQRWVCIPRHSITLISRSRANSVQCLSILKPNSDSLISTQITSCRTCQVHSAHCDIGQQHRSWLWPGLVMLKAALRICPPGFNWSSCPKVWKCRNFHRQAYWLARFHSNEDSWALHIRPGPSFNLLSSALRISWVSPARLCEVSIRSWSRWKGASRLLGTGGGVWLLMWTIHGLNNLGRYAIR